jgi:hypothetical protein
MAALLPAAKLPVMNTRAANGKESEDEEDLTNDKEHRLSREQANRPSATKIERKSNEHYAS